MTYIQYVPQYCRNEKQNNVYQPHSNNIQQPYNSVCVPSGVLRAVLRKNVLWCNNVLNFVE